MLTRRFVDLKNNVEKTVDATVGDHILDVSVDLLRCYMQLVNAGQGRTQKRNRLRRRVRSQSGLFDLSCHFRRSHLQESRRPMRWRRRPTWPRVRPHDDIAAWLTGKSHKRNGRDDCEDPVSKQELLRWRPCPEASLVYWNSTMCKIVLLKQLQRQKSISVYW